MLLAREIDGKQCKSVAIYVYINVHVHVHVAANVVMDPTLQDVVHYNMCYFIHHVGCVRVCVCVCVCVVCVCVVTL